MKSELILSYLGPGGYIQWKEVDFSMMSCKAAAPDLSTSNVKELMRWMYEFPLKKFTSFEYHPIFFLFLEQYATGLYPNMP